MTRIEPRTGTAIELSKGQVLTVIDPEGGQVSDLLAVSRADPAEILSNGRTFDYEERIMLTILEDTAPAHDFLLTPCSKDTFRHFYPDKPVHRGCFGNLAEALEPYGIEPDDITTAFNVFMNVPVASDGALSVDPPQSPPGTFTRFRADMDLVIGLTACAAYASNGGTFNPIDYDVSG